MRGTRGSPLQRYILTNAHSVAYHTLVQVRLHGESAKVTARVLAVAHDCDVAVLTVDEPRWWDGALTLTLGVLPQLHQSVVVVGYPLGGDQVRRYRYDSQFVSARSPRGTTARRPVTDLADFRYGGRALSC